MAPDEHWTVLRSAYAEARFTREAEDTPTNRRIVFEDGTVWFPDGAGEALGTTVALPILGGLFLVCGVATVVGWHDGSSWGWAAAAAWAATVVGTSLVLRHDRRQRAAAEATLSWGVFLLRDALVVRHGGAERRVPRAQIDAIEIRHAMRGGEASRPWIHLRIRTPGRGDQTEDLPTDLTKPALAIVQAWRNRDA